MGRGRVKAGKGDREVGFSFGVRSVWELCFSFAEFWCHFSLNPVLLAQLGLAPSFPDPLISPGLALPPLRGHPISSKPLIRASRYPSPLSSSPSFSSRMHPAGVCGTVQYQQLHSPDASDSPTPLIRTTREHTRSHVGRWARGCDAESHPPAISPDFRLTVTAQSVDPISGLDLSAPTPDERRWLVGETMVSMIDFARVRRRISLPRRSRPISGGM